MTRTLDTRCIDPLEGLAQASPVTRPLMRYHGGKFRLAPWIISHLPAHRIYTEAYGGAASVLLRKPRAYSEVYNDLSGEVVNLFRVLRNPAQARELVRLVKLTPYAREEFEESYILADDPIEQARRTLFRAGAGFGATAASGQWRTGFRSNVTRSGTIPAGDWQTYPDVLEAAIERLRGVVIEHMPALDLLAKYDHPDALHYVDPPYMAETRGRHSRKAYRHEMTDADHVELAGMLHALKGHVVLSGYPSPLYDSLYTGWQRYTRTDHADDSTARVEVLWVKSDAPPQPSLFETEAA
jgi:DNA adenine methylase